MLAVAVIRLFPVTCRRTCCAALTLSLFLRLFVSTGSTKCTSSSSDDVEVQTVNCLDEYKAFKDGHQLTGSALFTSADVEIIRTLCSNVKTSMRCLRSLRDRCPTYEHHKRVDHIARPILTKVVELCDHQRLYEEYAMNQNCLHGQRDVSERCYASFVSHVHHRQPDAAAAAASPHQHHHSQSYCSHVADLVTCVRSNFALTCGDASVKLVEQLVNAAIDDGQRCWPTDHPHDNAFTVSSHHVGSHRQSLGGASSRLSPSAATVVCSIFFLVLAFIHRSMKSS